jgi:protease-4
MLSKKNGQRIFVAIVVVLLVLALTGWLASSRAIACNVAYIKLHGTLVDYIPNDQAVGSDNVQDQTASEDVTKSIREAAADPRMKAIVLEIDSAGGDPVAGNEVESALKQVDTPTVALIRSDGNSAAYKAATGADVIFASDDSDVGDIGVTESYTDVSTQDATNGITFNQLSVGEYKDMFNEDKPLTADEKTLIMSQLEIQYRSFVQMVAQNRHLSVADVTALADGAPILGEEALRDGLIDKIGDVDDVRSFLTQKIGRSAVICGIDTN